LVGLAAGDNLTQKWYKINSLNILGGRSNLANKEMQTESLIG